MQKEKDVNNMKKIKINLEDKTLYNNRCKFKNESFNPKLEIKL